MSTPMVWSCAVTSLRDFGRLVMGGVRHYGDGHPWGGLASHYFSTHGTSLPVSLCVVGMASFCALEAASRRALRSKNEAIVEWKGSDLVVVVVVVGGWDALGVRVYYSMYVHTYIT